MRDWGEATTTIGIIEQITREGGEVRFHNRGTPSVAVLCGGNGPRRDISDMNEPEIVKTIWGAWQEAQEYANA